MFVTFLTVHTDDTVTPGGNARGKEALLKPILIFGQILGTGSG